MDTVESDSSASLEGTAANVAGGRQARTCGACRKYFSRSDPHDVCPGCKPDCLVDNKCDQCHPLSEPEFLAYRSGLADRDRRRREKPGGGSATGSDRGRSASPNPPASSKGQVPENFMEMFARMQASMESLTSRQASFEARAMAAGPGLPKDNPPASPDSESSSSGTASVPSVPERIEALYRLYPDMPRPPTVPEKELASSARSQVAEPVAQGVLRSLPPSVLMGSLCEAVSKSVSPTDTLTGTPLPAPSFRPDWTFPVHEMPFSCHPKRTDPQVAQLPALGGGQVNPNLDVSFPVSVASGLDAAARHSLYAISHMDLYLAALGKQIPDNLDPVVARESRGFLLSLSNCLQFVTRNLGHISTAVTQQRRKTILDRARLDPSVSAGLLTQSWEGDLLFDGAIPKALQEQSVVDQRNSSFSVMEMVSSMRRPWMTPRRREDAPKPNKSHGSAPTPPPQGGGGGSQEENDELVKKVEELQEKLDALDGIGEEETKSLLAQKDEEIQKLRTKLKLEEEDAIKRDQALIHGYNAEIASYKAQITELKTRLREATGASPQKSPRKTPKKTPQKKEDDAFKNHLCSQIKGFQTELDKNSCAVSELKQALEIAHSAAADLEKKLETESSHHDETRIALAELREKMKCSIEERDETISQLKNQGEKFSKDLEFKSEHISELEFSLEELKCSLQSLQEEKEKLTSERSDLLEVVASKDTLIVDHVDVKETLKEKLGTVQEDLKKKEKEIEALQKSVEELEMVKSELKQMLNASTSQQEKMLLEKMMNKDNEMEKQISAQKEQFTKVIAEKEVELVNMKEMLVSRSEEHQKLLDQKDAEKVKLEKDLEHHKDEVMALMKKKEEELQAKVVQINELVCEIEILKRETSEKTVVCEKVKSDLQRLEKDSSEIETLKTTCQASKERLAELQNQLSEKESKNKELEASLEEIHSALSGKEKEFEGSVLRLRGELEQAHDQLQEKESKLLKQEETMKLLESRVCDMDETCKEVKLEQVSIIQKLSNVNEASQQMEQKAREAESIIREKEEEVAGLQDELQRREDKVKMLTKEHRAEISDLKTELGAKEHELEQVQKSYSDMQALLSSSDAKLSQLSEASLEIAELKSALHMEKTLHVKYQTELEEAVSEKEKVEAALTTCQENLKVALEKEGNAEAEAERRQESLRAVTTAKQEIEQRLEECQHKLTVMEQKSSERESQLKDLQDQLVENKDEKEELESKLKETDEMFRKEKEACKMLQDQVDGYAHELNQVKTSEETHLSEAKEQLQEKLKLSSERIADLEKQLMTAEEKVTGYEREIEKLDSERKKGAMKENVGSSVNESKGHGFDFSELRGELEAEQKKNNEFHKLVENMTGDMDSTSGNARKLRKEKIEAECALVNAKYEIKSLKRKLDRCQGGTLVLSPTKLADSDNRKWDESEKKLQVLQDKHAKCVEELEECRSKITTLEQKVDKLKSELLEKKQEVLALSRSAESSAKERTSSSSVTSTDSFVHDELQRSQERERNLRQQLQQASESMKENITRISELEEQLTGQQNTFLETQDKMEALQKEKDKLCLEQTTSDELKQEMKQLRADLERKSEKLEQRSTALKDLKRAQEAERERFEVALRDAKANENVIEQLKVALTEQEETMAAQDKVMNNKDDENKALSEELEKMTEKYRQMLDQRGDSSRELRDNMKALTKAEVERDEMKREVDKLNSERNQKDIVIRENNHEIKELEKSLAEKRQEIVELKSSVDREVHKHVEDKKAETNATIEDLKTKLRAKEHDLRKIEREIQKYEDQLREMRKQVTDKEQEMEAWREHRDKLVGSLEALMKKQAAEIKELKHERDSVHIKEEVTSQMEEKEARINELEGKLQNLEHMMTYNQRTPGGSGARGRKRSTVNANPDMDHLKKQLEQEREDKLELQKQLRVVQKASDHIVADLKASNTQLQVQVAALQGVPPPPKPPRVDPAFVNDDYPTEGRHQIDVTPPVAAKALKKSGRKRVTAKEETAAPDSDETPRTKRGRGRPSKTKKEADPAPVECLARIVEEETQKKRTRSAKKSSADVPVVVTEVDLDAGNKRGKRGRRKLYSEEVSAPFECAPFVPPTATTSKVDVHNVVQRRLRGRRTNMTDV